MRGAGGAVPLALLLAAASCARTNADIIRDLEQRSRDQPRPGIETLLDTDRPVALAASGPRAVVLPLVQGRVPAVTGRVNGTAMPLVLDTGTTHVGISGPGAEEAGVHVPPHPPVETITPGFTTPHRLAVFDSIEFGGLRLGAGVATIPERARTGFGLGTNAYAIVGCAVLSHFTVTFDFARDEVRLVRHGRPGYTTTLFQQVVIEGREYWLLVDSGATRVFLEPWVALELGLIAEQETARLRDKAKSPGAIQYSRFKLRAVRIGDRTFRDVPAGAMATFPDELGTDFRPAGLLGLRAFGRRVWTLDFGTRQLHPPDEG